MEKSLETKRFRLGACYYPEHWPEALWADDFRRMKEMGFSVIRVAEFAWSIFEPVEGEFHFDLFDRALDLAYEYGIDVIMGTPTATPPAWLTSKYPEVLNVTQTGVQYQHGQRRHYNYNAPIYRDLSARIVRQMAEHYRNHPAIIGWQIDNEFNCEVNVFYSVADHKAFRAWLALRYGSLDKLNEAWGAVFWNQTYTDWSQVYLTRPTVSDSPNPHQALDEKRFISDSAISFARLQSDIIRSIAPNHFVTTNGIFGHLDSHQMTDEALDFISYDSYPNFHTIWPDGGERPLLDRSYSWGLSTARSISPNFCVMEQQSGAGGWVNKMEAPSPKPGQMRLWTYQSIAHGADMLLYFRWRTATKGTEIYWHGINDYHNQPNRRVAEATRVGNELAAIGDKLVGSRFVASVAIVRDYDNEWDGELDKWHGPLTQRSTAGWVKALQRAHIPVDALYLRDNTDISDLLQYPVLIYPHPAILSAKTAALLTQYVEQGGKLVFGGRTGYKDTTSHCYMTPFPGPVAELCGITVEDFTMIGAYQTAPTLRWTNEGQNRMPAISPDDVLSSNGVASGGESLDVAEAFNDILCVHSPSATVLATYAGDYYEGKPALVQNKVGPGQVFYYGASFTESVAKKMVHLLGLHSPLAGDVILAEDVELAIRHDASQNTSFVFLLNYAHEAKTMELKRPFVDLLTGQPKSGVVSVEPFGVMVLQYE